MIANNSPSVRRQTVGSRASSNYVPTGGTFRALNISVAGLLTTIDCYGNTVQTYENLGWAPISGKAVVNTTTASTDTATVIAAELEMNP